MACGDIYSFLREPELRSLLSKHSDIFANPSQTTFQAEKGHRYLRNRCYQPRIKKKRDYIETIAHGNNNHDSLSFCYSCLLYSLHRIWTQSTKWRTSIILCSRCLCRSRSHTKSHWLLQLIQNRYDNHDQYLANICYCLPIEDSPERNRRLDFDKEQPQINCHNLGFRYSI